MTEPSTILHLIFSASGCNAALCRAATGDRFVLLGEGAYALQALQSADVGAENAFALAVDLAQRGIEVDIEPSAVTPIDDPQLVDLITAATRTVSWR